MCVQLVMVLQALLAVQSFITPGGDLEGGGGVQFTKRLDVKLVNI